MDQYAVIGHPVGHSQSPFIHQQFARQTGQILTYRALLSPLDSFSQTLAEFRAQGGKGANITLPFKEQALSLCDELGERARSAGAVNTVYWREDGRLVGDNTDGVGLVADLLHAGVALEGRRILMLGAGGAVRGVLQPLLAHRPEALVIANRTRSKAEILAEDFASQGKISAVGLEEIQGQFDVIINGTSASLFDQLPPLPEDCLKANATTYDMAYAAKATAFQRWGEQQGAITNLSGLGMLVRQAAESFFIWRGIRPDVEPVMTALTQRMATT